MFLIVKVEKKNKKKKKKKFGHKMNVVYPISNGKSSRANDHIEYEKKEKIILKELKY